MILNLPKAVLIDVDGTMVDSVPDLAYCVDEMMIALGMATHGEDKVRHWVGNGVERLVRRALIGQLDGEPDDALFDRAYPMYLELYAANTCERSVLYPGVREGIDFLKGAGVRLGCVTNKAEQFTLPLLKTLGIFGDCRHRVGDPDDGRTGDVGRSLRPPAYRRGKKRHHHAGPRRKAARAAGFNVVCMTYGYNHGVDIRQSEPDAVIDSMAELSGLFATTALLIESLP